MLLIPPEAQATRSAVRACRGAAESVTGIWRAESLRGRFARGAVWSLLGALIAQGANLIASLLTARLLGRERFGEYGMIQNTVGMLGVFAGLGLGVTTTRFVAEFRESDPDRAGRIIALGWGAAIVSGGIIAIALLVLAPQLAATTLNGPALARELRIGSALLFFSAVNGAQIGALSGFEAFRAIAGINLTRGLVTLPVTAALTMLWGLPGAVWALAVIAAITCCHGQLSLRRQCLSAGIHPHFRSAWAERWVLWTFSTPAFLSGAMAGPALWAANSMLVHQPGGYSEMGLFSAASQWRSAIAFLPGVLAQFALPLLSNLHGERDFSRYRKALCWNLLLTTLTASAVAVPVTLCAPWVMSLYGKGFQQGSLVLVLSAITAVISCVNSVVGTAILSAGSVWLGLLFNGMWAAVLVAASYYLISTNLSLGLAAAMLLAYLAHTIWQGLYLSQRVMPAN